MITQSKLHLQYNKAFRLFFLNELRSLIYEHHVSAYIKFTNIGVGIEYPGACIDQHVFSGFGESENRFNKALKKLFPKEHKEFALERPQKYLYREFRCSFIHQLRPDKGIVVSHSDESKREGTTQLYNNNAWI